MRDVWFIRSTTQTERHFYQEIQDSRLCAFFSNIGVYMKNRGKWITDMRKELTEGVTFSAGKTHTHKKKTNTFHSQHMCKLTMPH